EAAAKGSTETRVRATFDKVALMLSSGKMSRPEAIKELEGLRYAWRGDGFEFDLLRRLGELQLAEGEYENGLTTLRRAVTLFPGMDGAEAITQTMTDTFAKLYLGGAADALPPIKALGLYEDFRELTPTGEKGDQVILTLAERLAAVDLLSQAADLLDQEVNFRLQGEPKARAGARLATLRLLDKKPDLALAAINASRIDNLPPDLAAERRHIEVRALADLGRTEDSLAMMKGDDSAEADMIRADILWAKRDWAAAAKVLERLVGKIESASKASAESAPKSMPESAPGSAPQSAPKALAEDQSLTVLRLAVALWLANDRTELESVRQRFAALMDATPYRDDFRVIAAAAPEDVSSVAAVSQRLAEVDEYAAFLKGIRQRQKADEVANAAN
ncbi:MAG: hypothetical protein WCF16_01245, partial [Alphaproteobacteria bacterium]